MGWQSAFAPPKTRSISEVVTEFFCGFTNVNQRETFAIASDYDNLIGDPRRLAGPTWGAKAFDAPLSVEARFAAIERRLAAGVL